MFALCSMIIFRSTQQKYCHFISASLHPNVMKKTQHDREIDNQNFQTDGATRKRGNDLKSNIKLNIYKQIIRSI